MNIKKNHFLRMPEYLHHGPINSRNQHDLSPKFKGRYDTNAYLRGPLKYNLLSSPSSCSLLLELEVVGIALTNGGEMVSIPRFITHKLLVTQSIIKIDTHEVKGTRTYHHPRPQTTPPPITIMRENLR
ncbi:hypothetical protein TWF225_010912 [Orbilia oligospora]|nr:hypothetical protein TWF751_005285 [Orbilia oligospora]KAF3193060.1 hypothetical protein TWF225_010912 [Orbilia oligospora]KAF3265779.1 hypothetical protein TWF217_002314 [Orbilia oligospora]